jgi:hypothetical protein
MTKENRDKAAKLINLQDGDSITDQQAEELLFADMHSVPEQLVVTVEHARTTSMQYNTNRYSAQVTINLGPIKELINSKDASSVERVGRLVLSKFRRAEQFLNVAIREAEAKDNIQPLPGSRFEK